MHDAQLQARGFWTEIAHAELGRLLTYPRPCVAFSEASCDIRRCAPLIGEHNEEEYVGELGCSKEEVARLREKRVV
jgi:formyl-CoA transferase